jgi:hypothetical protein
MSAKKFDMTAEDVMKPNCPGERKVDPPKQPYATSHQLESHSEQ